MRGAHRTYFTVYFKKYFQQTKVSLQLKWSVNYALWNMFKVKNTAPERCQWRRSDVFIVNFEHISLLFLMFLLLTLNR